MLESKKSGVGEKQKNFLFMGWLQIHFSAVSY